MTSRSGRVILAAALMLAASSVVTAQPFSAAELAPREVSELPGGARIAGYSERTLVVALEVDRDEARVVHYTVKPRPFRQLLEFEPPRAYDEHRPLQLEVILSGGGDTLFTRRVEVPFLCMLHGGDDASHVEGDTVRRHRTGVLVELPEVAGFDEIEVAFYEPQADTKLRRPLGTRRLEPGLFTQAAGGIEYADVLFADEKATDKLDLLKAAAPVGSTAMWPEDFGDTDIYRVYGDESEVDSRINVVIVPDGYTYAQKSSMEAHMDDLVTALRAHSPHKEHDSFYNYILVYAYSVESGTDQCDCAIIRDTAFGSFYPSAVPGCGNSANRCLQYASSGAGACDSGGMSNVLEAELRAPAQDTTGIMVNTTRYGGCAGDRMAFAADLSISPLVAIHEFGHSWVGLADEYGGSGCGASARELNTSTNPVDGAWPEWVPTIGPPVEGGQTFDECIYRPRNTCRMRSNNSPFCEVCNQRWALETFDHARISPTAPVTSFTPDVLAQVEPGGSIDFEVLTRLAVGDNVVNEFTWTLEGPGFAGPTVVATGSPTHTQSFALEGQYVLTCDVVADANFIKPSKYGANAETVTWLIAAETDPPAEVEGPVSFPNKTLLLWDPIPNVGYNVYRGLLTGPPLGDYGTCFVPGLDWTTSFIFDAEVPPPGVGWTYLVAGWSVAGEGALGYTSDGVERVNANPCP